MACQRMSTPRLSDSSDQMRRMQMSASGGGECAEQSRLEKIDDVSAAGLARTTAMAEGTVAMPC